MSLFSSPIGRLEYLGRQIFGAVLFVIAWLLMALANRHESLVLVILALIPLFLTSFYIVVFAVFPRLESIGLSRWFTLVLFIPVAGILFHVFLQFCPAGWLMKNDKVA
jgi:hypothetical protein